MLFRNSMDMDYRAEIYRIHGKVKCFPVEDLIEAVKQKLDAVRVPWEPGNTYSAADSKQPSLRQALFPDETEDRYTPLRSKTGFYTFGNGIDTVNIGENWSMQETLASRIGRKMRNQDYRCWLRYCCAIGWIFMESRYVHTAQTIAHEIYEWKTDRLPYGNRNKN